MEQTQVYGEIDEDNELLLFSHEDTLKVCKWLLENGDDFAVHSYDDEDTSVEIIE